MKKPLRESLAQSVCNQLIKAIKENIWKNTLPGIRALSDKMQVSKQTMMTALQLLEKAGYVDQPSPGKPRKINDRLSDVVSSEHAPSIIGFITYVASDKLSSFDNDVYLHINSRLKRQGLKLKEIVCKDLWVNAGAENIKSVINQYPADVYIAVGASPDCKRELRSLELPIIYLGGDAIHGCYPRVGISVEELCTRAISHLISLGHRKISVMLPEHLNRKNRTATKAENVIKNIFDSKHLPFSTYNCPRWGKTKANFLESLEKLFGLTPPTAIILSDDTHVPRLVSFLLSRGLRYPDDISIVVLEGSPLVDEFHPSITYIEKPTAALAKIVVSEVKELLLSPNGVRQDFIVVKSKLIINDSVKDIN